MRENLLFYNIPEENSFEQRKNENCIEKVLEICKNDLQIGGDASNFKIDRAHRIGRYEHGKSRPVVVKFNFFGDKLAVKEAARTRLRGSPLSVSEQYPKAIQDRRKSLIPYLVQARQQGKDASLSYDALYIDRVRYTHDRPPSGPVPELPPRRHGMSASQSSATGYRVDRAGYAGRWQNLGGRQGGGGRPAGGDRPASGGRPIETEPPTNRESRVDDRPADGVRTSGSVRPDTSDPPTARGLPAGGDGSTGSNGPSNVDGPAGGTQTVVNEGAAGSDRH